MPKKKSRPKAALHPQNNIKAWFFVQPYYGVPWLVFFYALLACLIYTTNGPLSGHLIGFDDTVRMVQVQNWLNGAGWYDRLITRANPPDGFQSIWPRIVDIPIAAIVLLGEVFTDQKTAIFFASFVLPFIELAILFGVTRYLARVMVGKKEARLIALFVMFTPVLNHKQFTFAGFHPGEASHHSWYVILNALMFGAAARLALGIQTRSPIMLLALGIGLLLAVGIEGFPMIAGVAAVLAVVAWLFSHPQLAFRGAAAIGIGAFLGLILLPMNVPPAHLLNVTFAQPSILGPILVAAAAAALAIEAVILSYVRRYSIVSAVLIAGATGAIAAALVFFFPQILSGPAAALSPTEREMAFHEHPEAWSMFDVAFTTFDFICLTAPILISLVAGIYALKNCPNKRRKRMYATCFGISILTAGMSQWLWRYYHHAMIFACVWLLWTWQQIRKQLIKNRTYTLSALGVFVFLGPLWMLLLPALSNNMPFTTGVMLFPGLLTATPLPCDAARIGSYLDAHYSPQTDIIVPRDDSAAFLFYSRLTIDFVALYPSQDKFVDNVFFFDLQDMKAARSIAKKHNFDLVAVCLATPIGQNPPPVMIARLMHNKPPKWLKLVDDGLVGNYALYEVDHESLLGGENE